MSPWSFPPYGRTVPRPGLCRPMHSFLSSVLHLLKPSFIIVLLPFWREMLKTWSAAHLTFTWGRYQGSQSPGQESWWAVGKQWNGCPSAYYLVDCKTRKLKMFLLFPCILLHGLLPGLLPVLVDQPHQGLHPHQNLVLQGGAGAKSLMEKRLSAARVLVLMFLETSWLAGGASHSAWQISSTLSFRFLCQVIRFQGLLQAGTAERVLSGPYQRSRYYQDCCCYSFWTGLVLASFFWL